MTFAWVLGSTGLLGTALCSVLRGQGIELFYPDQRFAWADHRRLFAQLTHAAQDFVRRSTGFERWEIYWAAGTGTMGSGADAMARETEALAWLLQRLEASAPQLPSFGCFALASSAGAIYAGAVDEVITEETAASPTTAYAEAKLAQERMLLDFVRAAPRRAALAARISTLYGAGQASGKGQGLLTHMARSLLRNQPIQIYVPYDTVRDYIAAGDAAGKMVEAMRLLPTESRFVVKIIASECPVTIAEIVSIFKRVARKNPRIVTSANRLSALYARRVQFRSVALPNTSGTAVRRLPVGIAQLLMAERMAFVEGSVESAASRVLCSPKEGKQVPERLETTRG
jgi:UDP-glucose 4-epimerase